MIAPKPHSQPKPKRLPQRKAVTIIAGFKSWEGVVLCADTQETVEYSKRKASKLRYEPKEYGTSEDHTSNLAAAFCGSGSGPFIDKLVEQAWKRAKRATDLDSACDEIEKSIKEQYREFGKIYQQGQCPEVQLIFGVKMDGASKLFSAWGPIVNQKDGFDAGGVGQYMADFLASRMFQNHLSVHQCVILAAYILFQTKEHVDGCGGDSQIIVLRDRGASGTVDWRHVEAMTKILEMADSALGELLLRSANLEMKQEQLKEAVDLATSLFETYRSNAADELEKWAAITEGLMGHPHRVDAFGLPKPSDDQTEEPEQ